MNSSSVYVDEFFFFIIFYRFSNVDTTVTESQSIEKQLELAMTKTDI